MLSSVYFSGISEASTVNSVPGSIKRKTTLTRMDDSTSEELKTLIQLMGANDWQKRQEGIEQFHDLTMRNPDACVAQLVKVILEYKKYWRFIRTLML